MSIDDLNQRIRSFEFTDFSGPIAPSLVNSAQQALGLPLSREYRQFLEHFGSGGVESEEFIGLGGKPHLDVVRLREDLLQRERPFPKHLLPVRGDGFGNYDCIDTSAPTEKGEFAVVYWLHDGGEHQTYQQLASSYFEWFNSILDRIETELS